MPLLYLAQKCEICLGSVVECLREGRERAVGARRVCECENECVAGGIDGRPGGKGGLAR